MNYTGKRLDLDLDLYEMMISAAGMKSVAMFTSLRQTL